MLFATALLGYNPSAFDTSTFENLPPASSLLDLILSKVELGKTCVKKIFHGTVYTGVVVGKVALAGSLAGDNFWRVMFEDCDDCDFTNLELVEILELKTTSTEQTSTIDLDIDSSSSSNQTSKRAKLSKAMDLSQHLKQHILCTPSTKPYTTTKLAVSNATCELARIGQCFTEANKNNIKTVLLLETSSGMPAEPQKCVTYCTGCKTRPNSKIDYLYMCELCFSHYHTSNGFWKMNANTFISYPGRVAKKAK